MFFSLYSRKKNGTDGSRYHSWCCRTTAERGASGTRSWPNMPGPNAANSPMTLLPFPLSRYFSHFSCGVHLAWLVNTVPLKYTHRLLSLSSSFLPSPSVLLQTDVPCAESPYPWTGARRPVHGVYWHCVSGYQALQIRLLKVASSSNYSQSWVHQLNIFKHLRVYIYRDPIEWQKLLLITMTITLLIWLQ